jgi:SpoVK/Ycf46/Vps4 family AAA+-type ATPase
VFALILAVFVIFLISWCRLSLQSTGVDPLSVPTLLIGLTNKPSLIDPALMRPGRFEVKVEVPKPKVC